MAGTGGKRFMRQGFGYPELAAGQGEKAGPPASSSCDRSSTLVGDLANVELNTTKKKGEVVSQSHNCDLDYKRLLLYLLQVRNTLFAEKHR